MINALNQSKLSIKTQTLTAAIAVASAVALPQLIHGIGHLSGTGTALGELLLPMHFPIMLAGLLAGPYAAGIAGLLAPLLSFALTGMPLAAMLPFMMIELCVYGICAGLLRKAKCPSVCKVLLTQVAGRAVRAAAILFAFHALNSTVQPAIILKSIPAGLLGILLQLVLIPLILYRVKEADRD